MVFFFPKNFLVNVDVNGCCDEDDGGVGNSGPNPLEICCDDMNAC